MSSKGSRIPALAAVALLAVPASVAAKDPSLTVPAPALRSALICHGAISPRTKPPIIFAPGTGTTGSGVYALGKGAFDAIGRPFCTVTFPDRTTADVQVSVQYLVHAVRTSYRRAGRPVAIIGVSQGGLLARFALTSWPSLRTKVSDVVSVAGTQHGGMSSPESALKCLQQGCPPAIWQQGVNSRFLKALNNGRDETPGPTAWTTVRSATDEVVQPATGPRPTSVLKGATNILIQDVCPGRQTSHLGTAVDSVTIAAVTDAVSHRGPARVSRLPAGVCAHPYGTGLDEQQTAAFLDLASQLSSQATLDVPVVRREPKVRPWVSGPRR